MRPYRLRIRLSSRRLNVTRFGGGIAVAARATARFSLGSVSSDIELMQRLLSSDLYDCANRRTPQGGVNAREPRRTTRFQGKHRFTGSLAESYCCPTSANRPPRWVATR